MTQQTQLSLDLSRAARDAGITKAITHADAVIEKWSDQAYRFFEMWVRTKDGCFLAEDFRESVVGVLPDPPHKRAFGGVIQKAVKAGLIRKVGYAQVKNVTAHMANCSVWEKV